LVVGPVCTILGGAVVLGPALIRWVLVIQRRRVAGRQPLQALLQVLPLAPLDHGPFPVVGWLAIAR
jgi:hypothetical protein